MIRPEAAKIDELRSRLTGTVILTGDEAYDSARTICAQIGLLPISPDREHPRAPWFPHQADGVLDISDAVAIFGFPLQAPASCIMPSHDSALLPRPPRVPVGILTPGR